MIKSRLVLLGVAAFTTVLSLFGSLSTVAYAADSTTITCDDGRQIQTYATNPDKATICASSTPEPCGSSTVFFIPAWYKGLQDSSCAFSPAYTDSVSNKPCVKGSTADCKPNISKTALLVGLNVLQAALVVVGYITIIFLIKGGFEYMLSTGDPGRITSAKGTIRNAVIGLVIAILAASIVNAIGGMIPGA